MEVILIILFPSLTSWFSVSSFLKSEHWQECFGTGAGTWQGCGPCLPRLLPGTPKLRLICPENFDLANAPEGHPSSCTSFFGDSTSSCSALIQGTKGGNTS